MSLIWPSILQAMESSVEIMCESLEDLTKPSEIDVFLPVMLRVSALHYSTGITEGLEGFRHWLQLMHCT